MIKALPQLKKIDSQEITEEEKQKAFQTNFDHLIGVSKNPNNRNVLQQNLMSQNNARKSPFKSNENLQQP